LSAEEGGRAGGGDGQSARAKVLAGESQQARVVGLGQARQVAREVVVREVVDGQQL
jgi:hypothetical protein